MATRSLRLPGLAIALAAIVLGLIAIGCSSSSSDSRGATSVAPTAPPRAEPASSAEILPGLRGTTINVGGDTPFTATGKIVEYTVVAEQAEWELLPGVTTMADTYNGTVPGPTLRVTEGDTFRVTLRNELPEPTTIHWHGVHVPNAMDGVEGLNQPSVMPGESFVYEFTASHAGTFMYHSHSSKSREQIERGLYGMLIIDPQQPAPTKFDREYMMALQGWMIGDGGGAMGAMQMGGAGGGMMDYNYFTINGKSYPATEPLTVKQGELVRVRIVNPSQTIHPMHLHGQDFKVVAKDGEPVPAAAQLMMNTVTVNPGETFDIAFVADNPGRWAFHCHDLHHVANNGVEPGGLLTVVEYEGYDGGPVPTPKASGTQMPQSMPGMGH